MGHPDKDTHYTVFKFSIEKGRGTMIGIQLNYNVAGDYCMTMLIETHEYVNLMIWNETVFLWREQWPDGPPVVRNTT